MDPAGDRKPGLQTAVESHLRRQGRNDLFRSDQVTGRDRGRLDLNSVLVMSLLTARYLGKSAGPLMELTCLNITRGNAQYESQVFLHRVSSSFAVNRKEYNLRIYSVCGSPVVTDRYSFILFSVKASTFFSEGPSNPPVRRPRHQSIHMFRKGTST